MATRLRIAATLVHNACPAPHTGDDAPTFELRTTPIPKQQRALELIQQLRV